MMTMKRILLSAAVLLMPYFASAQQAEAKVALHPYVSYDLKDVSYTAANALESKLLRMVTANGFASLNNDFVITAVPSLTNIDVTATVPAQFVADVDVEIFVLNNLEQVIIDQVVIPLKGLGQSKDKAVVGAINQLNVKGPDVRRFMDNVRTKVLDYYALRLPAIISKAQAQAKMSNYDEALAILAVVPESLDEYPQIADMMVDFYQQSIDKTALALIRSAKVHLANDNVLYAMEDLMKVDPLSSHASEVNAIIVQVQAKADAEERRILEEQKLEREMEMKKYEDELEFRKMKLEASKEVALAQISSADAPTVSATGTSETAVFDSKEELASWFFGNLIKK